MVLLYCFYLCSAITLCQHNNHSFSYEGLGSSLIYGLLYTENGEMSILKLLEYGEFGQERAAASLAEHYFQGGNGSPCPGLHVALLFLLIRSTL